MNLLRSLFAQIMALLSWLISVWLFPETFKTISSVSVVLVIVGLHISMYIILTLSEIEEMLDALKRGNHDS